MSAWMLAMVSFRPVEDVDPGPLRVPIPEQPATGLATVEAADWLS